MGRNVPDLVPPRFSEKGTEALQDEVTPKGLVSGTISEHDSEIQAETEFGKTYYFKNIAV